MSNNLNLLSTSGGKRWNMWNIKKIQSAPGNKLVISGNLSNSVLNLGNNIDVSGNIYMNGNFKVPVGTTANRPSPNNYYFRYNTTIPSFEYNTGSTWLNILLTGGSTSTLASLTISGITNTGPFYLYPNLTTSATPITGGTTYYSITGTTSYSRALYNTGAPGTVTQVAVNNTGVAGPGGSGTITPNFSGPIFYVIVGGGGGAGNGTAGVCYGGGGGGGGVIAGNSIVTSGTSYPVIVGAGGNAYNSYGVANPGQSKIASSGQDGGPGGYSMVFGVVAGGGVGGRGSSAYIPPSAPAAVSSTPSQYGWGGSSGFPQNNSGGISQTFGVNPAQGGGGAGTSVAFAGSRNGANGLSIPTGISYSIAISAFPSGTTTFTSNTFGGGGGGGGDNQPFGTGGTGGGGAGEVAVPVVPSVGQMNLDGTCGLGGGGGAKRGDDNWYPGVGGSGIIILSFNTYA
jgi:hypothetical protein